MVGQITEPEDNTEVIDFNKIIEKTIFEGILEDTEDKIVEENMGIIGVMIITEAGIGQGKGHSQGIMIAIGIEVTSNIRSRSGSRASY